MHAGGGAGLERAHQHRRHIVAQRLQQHDQVARLRRAGHQPVSSHKSLLIPRPVTKPILVSLKKPVTGLLKETFLKERVLQIVWCAAASQHQQ